MFSGVYKFFTGGGGAGPATAKLDAAGTSSTAAAGAPPPAAAAGGALGPHGSQAAFDQSLDITEVYQRIFICGLPYAGRTVNDARTRRNNADELAVHLDRRFGPRRYLVLNLAPEERGQYDEARFHAQVLYFRPALEDDTVKLDEGLPLITGDLYRACYVIEFWLRWHPDHVVVLHDVDGKRRSAAAVAAYLTWRHQDAVGDAVSAMNDVLRLRQHPGGEEPVRLPLTWRQVLLNFTTTVQAGVPAPPRRLLLSKIFAEMYGELEDHEDDISLQVYEGGRLVWDSDVDAPPPHGFVYTGGSMKASVDRYVCGDVIILIYCRFVSLRHGSASGAPALLDGSGAAGPSGGSGEDVGGGKGDARVERRVVVRYAFHTNTMPPDAIPINSRSVDIFNYRGRAVLARKNLSLYLVLTEPAGSSGGSDGGSAHAAADAPPSSSVLASPGAAAAPPSSSSSATSTLARGEKEWAFAGMLNLAPRGQHAVLAGLYHLTNAHCVYPETAAWSALCAEGHRSIFAAAALQLASRDVDRARRLLGSTYLRNLAGMYASVRPSVYTALHAELFPGGPVPVAPAAVPAAAPAPVAVTTAADAAAAAVPAAGSSVAGAAALLTDTPTAATGATALPLTSREAAAFGSAVAANGGAAGGAGVHTGGGIASLLSPGFRSGRSSGSAADTPHGRHSPNHGLAPSGASAVAGGSDASTGGGGARDSSVIDELTIPAISTAMAAKLAHTRAARRRLAAAASAAPSGAAAAPELPSVAQSTSQLLTAGGAGLSPVDARMQLQAHEEVQRFLDESVALMVPLLERAMAEQQQQQLQPAGGDGDVAAAGAAAGEGGPISGLPAAAAGSGDEQLGGSGPGRPVADGGARRPVRAVTNTAAEELMPDAFGFEACEQPSAGGGDGGAAAAVALATTTTSTPARPSASGSPPDARAAAPPPSLARAPSFTTLSEAQLKPIIAAIQASPDPSLYLAGLQLAAAAKLAEKQVLQQGGVGFGGASSALRHGGGGSALAQPRAEAPAGVASPSPAKPRDLNASLAATAAAAATAAGGAHSGSALGAAVSAISAAALPPALAVPLAQVSAGGGAAALGGGFDCAGAPTPMDVRRWKESLTSLDVFSVAELLDALVALGATADVLQRAAAAANAAAAASSASSVADSLNSGSSGSSAAGGSSSTPTSADGAAVHGGAKKKIDVSALATALSAARVEPPPAALPAAAAAQQQQQPSSWLGAMMSAFTVSQNLPPIPAGALAGGAAPAGASGGAATPLPAAAPQPGLRPSPSEADLAERSRAASVATIAAILSRDPALTPILDVLVQEVTPLMVGGGQPAAAGGRAGGVGASTGLLVLTPVKSGSASGDASSAGAATLPHPVAGFSKHTGGAADGVGASGAARSLGSWDVVAPVVDAAVHVLDGGGAGGGLPNDGSTGSGSGIGAIPMAAFTSGTTAAGGAAGGSPPSAAVGGGGASASLTDMLARRTSASLSASQRGLLQQRGVLGAAAASGAGGAAVVGAGDGTTVAPPATPLPAAAPPAAAGGGRDLLSPSTGSDGAVVSAHAPAAPPLPAAEAPAPAPTATGEPVDVEKYRRMLRMGVPEGAVRQKMAGDGVDLALLDGGAGEQQPPAAPAAASGAPADVSKYERMLRMGVPRDAVLQKMRGDGVDPALLPGGDAAAAAAPAEAAEPAPAAADVDVSKYEKMLKLGVPPGAVRQKMTGDGVDASLLNAVLVRLGRGSEVEAATPTPAAGAPPKAKTPAASDTDDAASDADGASSAAGAKRGRSAASDAEAAAARAARISELRQEQLDMVADASTPLASHRLYSRYVGMLRVGLPPEVVAHKMREAGLEPAVVIAGDPSAPPSGQPPLVPLRESDKYGKYWRMLKVGLPSEVVAHKMTSEGANPLALELEPALPAPPGLEAADGGAHHHAAAAAAAPVTQPRRPRKHRKRLHWEALPADRLSGTIWDDLNNASSLDASMGGPGGGNPLSSPLTFADDLIDDDELDRLFTQDATAGPGSGRGRAGGGADEAAAAASAAGKGVIYLVDAKRERNVGIGLLKLRLPNEGLRQCLLSLSCFGGGGLVLGTEQLTLLEGLLLDDRDDGDAIARARAFRGDRSRLSEASRFWVTVSDVPKARARASALAYQCTFDGRVAEAAARVDLLKRAVAQVRASPRLKRVLLAVRQLANKLNANDDDDHRGGGGSAHGRSGSGASSGIVAFRLDSLLKLSHTKAFDGRTTALRFLVSLFARKDPDALQLGADLPDVTDAGRLTLEGLTKDVTALRDGLAGVERLVREQALKAGGFDAVGWGRLSARLDGAAVAVPLSRGGSTNAASPAAAQLTSADIVHLDHHNSSGGGGAAGVLRRAHSLGDGGEHTPALLLPLPPGVAPAAQVLADLQQLGSPASSVASAPLPQPGGGGAPGGFRVEGGHAAARPTHGHSLSASAAGDVGAAHGAAASSSSDGASDVTAGDATAAASAGEALADFVGRAQARLATLAADEEAARAAFVGLLAYLGEEPTATPEATFSTLAQFVGLMRKTHREHDDDEAKRARELRRQASETARRNGAHHGSASSRGLSATSLGSVAGASGLLSAVPGTPAGSSGDGSADAPLRRLDFTFGGSSTPVGGGGSGSPGGEFMSPSLASATPRGDGGSEAGTPRGAGAEFAASTLLRPSSSASRLFDGSSPSGGSDGSGAGTLPPATAHRPPRPALPFGGGGDGGGGGGMAALLASIKARRAAAGEGDAAAAGAVAPVPPPTVAVGAAAAVGAASASLSPKSAVSSASSSGSPGSGRSEPAPLLPLGPAPARDNTPLAPAPFFAAAAAPSPGGGGGVSSPKSPPSTSSTTTNNNTTSTTSAAQPAEGAPSQPGSEPLQPPAPAPRPAVALGGGGGGGMAALMASIKARRGENEEGDA